MESSARENGDKKQMHVAQLVSEGDWGRAGDGGIEGQGREGPAWNPTVPARLDSILLWHGAVFFLRAVCHGVLEAGLRRALTRLIRIQA